MSFRTGFAEGARLAVGPAAATLALGVSFGAAAAAAGWGIAAPMFFSAFGFSGSAQFSLLTTLHAGSVVAAVAAAFLINARYMVMGIALNDSLKGGRLWRALQAQALVDASFMVAHKGGGRFDMPRLVGATAVQWLCWVVGTMVGLLLQPDPGLMKQLGVDVIFPAFFLLLVLDEVRHNRRAAVAALLGAAISGGLLLVTEPGYALLAATAGALIGLPAQREAEPEKEAVR